MNVANQGVPAGRAAMPLAKLLGWQRMRLLPAGILLAVAALVPLVVSNYYVINLLILIMIFAILNQSWNLTLGICGTWNFGQLGLFALGGYMTGITSVKLGLSPWLAMLLGVLVAGIANFPLMYPSLRLRGIYVALLTFSFAEVIHLLILNDDSGLTGGPFGFNGIPGLFDRFSPRAEQWSYYWLALALCTLTAYVIYRVVNSPLGLAFKTLRDSTRYSVSLGVSYRKYQLLATTLSALFAGLSGALYAVYLSSITPGVMGLGPLSLYVLMIVVGGMGTISGPILGTFVVMVLTEVLRDFQEWRLLVLGAALLLILVFQPAGLVGLMSKGVSGLKSWMEGGEASKIKSKTGAP